MQEENEREEKDKKEKPSSASRKDKSGKKSKKSRKKEKMKSTESISSSAGKKSAARTKAGQGKSKRIAAVDTDLCYGCGKCVKVCKVQALSLIKRV
ncbi:MAG: 4Fe-4S binding protein [Sphaerochaetaceae bacterium]|nr:4Fe-4S binding protein [Sphaerochaetaceae bacterium]